jgi:predicted phosphodiesterase
VALSDRLRELAEARTTAAAATAPTGWEPGIKYEADGRRIITMPAGPELGDESTWRQAVESLGTTVPDGYRVRLVEARFDPAAWQRDQQGDDATTRPVWRYRFVVEPAPNQVDVEELLRAARPPKPVSKPTSKAAFVFLTGDLQLGKPDGDGSSGTVERFYRSLDQAITRFKALRKSGHAGPVALVFAGDCIEGTQSQGGRLVARLDLTLTEQIRVYRRLALAEIQAFADLSDDVTVLAVPGNHGEAMRVGDIMASRYDDSWDVEGIVQVADILDAKGHTGITWMFPSVDELHVTAEIAGTRLGVLHGHQTRGKLDTWLASKALNREPIGTCDIVLSGHYHSLRIEHLGPVTHMRTGSLDGGSTWWQHRGGLASPPAAICFTTESGRWNNLQIV